MAGKNPLGVGFKVKDFFFDKKKIERDQNRKQGRFLARFGAIVRRGVKTLLRKKGGKSNQSSKPGEPPRQQTGLLRRSIFFAYQRSQKSVVIGPVVLSGASNGKVPESLEEGGSIVLREFNPSTKTRSGKKQTKRIAPRPYMGPEFADQKKRISSIWRDANR